MCNDIVFSIEIESLTGYYFPELFFFTYCPTRTTMLLINAVTLNRAYM